MPALSRTRLRAALGRPSAGVLVVTAVAACSGGGGATDSASGVGAASAASGAPSLVPMTTPAASGAPSGGGDAAIPDIVAQVEPSVVTILVGNGLGSGVVWRADGSIITNEHVVCPPPTHQCAEDVTVSLVDGSRVPGRVVATDRLTDIAVVDASREGLPPARFQTALPRVGELAITLGSPLGFQNSAGAGIISGLGREIPGSAAQGGNALVNLIQTDAAISPGNSGGALVNGAGEIVGINEAYIPPQAGAVNLGFAIPSATAVDVAQQLVDTGRAEHAYLGITPQSLTPDIAQQLGLSSAEGVLVYDVPSGSPADQAGVRPGDVITAIDQTPVRILEDLFAALRQKRPGDQMQVQVVRDGQQQTIPVTLGELPSTQ